MSDVSFRRARPGDAGAILDVKREAIEDLEHWQYSPDQVAVWKPKCSYLDTFERVIEDDRFVVHVAVDDGDLVGYGALNVPTSASTPSTSGRPATGRGSRPRSSVTSN